MSEQKHNKKSISLDVITRSGSSPEIISLLQETVFGTKGKVRYRQKHIAEGMKHQPNLEFIQIQKDNRILGTTGVVHRITSGLTKEFKSLYVRYLSVNNPFRKNQKRRPKNASVRTGRTSNTLKNLIGDQITNHFEKPVLDANEKASFYAFVESENYNSKELCINLGFYPTRRISTLLFSRFSPKTSKSIYKSTADEQSIIKNQLASFYEQHSYYFEDRLFESGIYFIKKSGDQIIAGIRCKPVNWEIVEVPGFSGYMMQNVLPYLPYTKRLFNPKDLNFLGFDYAFGSSKDLLELMEHCCSVTGIYMGMFWGDVEAPSIMDLKKSGKLGFIHTLNGDVTAEVMQRFINLTESEKDELLSKPVFVSALDMT